MTSSQVLIAHAVKVQAFPGAQSAARRVVFALLAVISLALIGVPSGLSAGSPALYSDALFVPFRLLVLDAQTGALRLLPAGDRRRAVIPHVPGLSRRPVDRPWEPEAAPDVSPALMQTLQPWRSRS